MTSDIKTAFDCIRAEESLKISTLIFLSEQIQKRSRPKRFVTVKRAAAVFASLIIVLMGAFSYDLYYKESVYVDLDVNPSIELSINRFNRVIDMYAYNAEGGEILDMVNIKHKNYMDAIGILIDAIVKEGYTSDAGLVSVTLQTGDKEVESAMLSGIEAVVREHHSTARVEAFPVSDEVRNAAHDLDLSPAKYLAILDLQEIDSTVTVEDCRDHSIGELKRLVEEHSTGHHESGGRTDNNEGERPEGDSHDEKSNDGYENSGDMNGNHRGGDVPSNPDAKDPETDDGHRAEGGDDISIPSVSPGEHNGENGRHNEGGHKNSGGHD